MARLTAWTGSTRSLVAFSFLSAYILSFLFEGQILYNLLDIHQVTTSSYIILAIGAHFLGLFTCGLFTKSAKTTRLVMIVGMGVAFLTLIPFFFTPSFLWTIGILVGGYASGTALAAWGFFLKAFTPKADRLKTCADALIGSNLVMVLINVCTVKWSPFLGLGLVMGCLLLGIVSMWDLTSDNEAESDQTLAGSKGELRIAFLLLCLFIAILTINSGLMYEVINPAFEHLTTLTSWYWAIPYIAALFIMRNLPSKAKHSRMLYVGMAMMVGAFIGFMFLGRDVLDYLIIDTLMLAACGVFDLFWWSILAEMLDYTNSPSRVFGIGLSANVLGVLSGGLIGMVAMSTQRINAEITVMALTVVCITLALLPVLNNRLTLLLKSHAYLVAYNTIAARKEIVYQTEALEPLTMREQEVLEEILAGKSNREIAATLYITENTVKTHTRNIYSKFAVHTRAELISALLKGDGL